jgi:hypothetical protein
VEQKLGEYWQTFETLKKPLLLQDLDFAVRENVKIKIQLLLQTNMQKFIEKGLTYDELENFQQELGLCPSVLESYPRTDKSLFQRFFGLFL